MSAGPVSGAGPEGTTSAGEVQACDTVLIPVVEETARIEKGAIEIGRVRVSTQLDTVEQVMCETLPSGVVRVTRVPIKDANQRTDTVADTVRRTEVEVEDERGNVSRTGTTGTDTRKPV